MTTNTSAGFAFIVDGLLRARVGFRRAPQVSNRQILMCVLLFGGCYGVVMGSYGWIVGVRAFDAQLLQAVYSGLKVPLLLLATVALSIPSFFVINTLLGLRSDMREAVRSIIAAQASLAIALASLAPLTAFWYVCASHSQVMYNSAVLVNFLFFGIASISSQLVLRQYYRPLIERNRRHRWMLWCWTATYAFVGIQMAWILRPFIGQPMTPTTFFRTGGFENAYLRVWSLVRTVVEAI